MPKSHHAIRLAMDQHASDAGRRAMIDLYRKHGRQIPVAALALAAQAFETAVRRGLNDSNVEGDHDSWVVHLVETWTTAAGAELRRLARHRGGAAPA